MILENVEVYNLGFGIWDSISELRNLLGSRNIVEISIGQEFIIVYEYCHACFRSLT